MQKPSACRLGTPCVARTFKQLLACRTQHHRTLELDVIADRAQVRRDRLYAYANENDSAQIPLIGALRVCDVIGNWDLLDFALDAYRRRTMSADRGVMVRSLIDEVLESAVAHGELVSVAHRAASDGVITDAERAEIRARIRKARRELDDIDASLDPVVPIARVVR